MGFLRYLFIDMNSFFASVEQQEKPVLRSKPIGILAAMTEGTCCIAASYEAKAYGVKTGTGVREARERCPQIQFVEARPKVYVQYHHRIIEAVESCLHVDQVSSIDEMYGRLLGREREPEQAAIIAFEVKKAIRQAIGPYVRCSIGVGPNIWLAKTASKLQKPDGMSMILPEQMPEAICHLELTDLTGIASNMAKRLHAAGIHTVEQLCRASQSELASAWSSKVLGDIWWSQLHGQDVRPAPTHRRTVGHSHVLEPARRPRELARAVAVRMLHKAATRMRKLGYRTRRLELSLRYVDGRKWHHHGATGLCRDSLTLARTLALLWQSCPEGDVLKVGVTLTNLMADGSATLPLYPSQANLDTLADAMDRVDHRYGQHTLYLASMWGAQTSAPTRISFTQVPKLDEFEPEEEEGVAVDILLLAVDSKKILAT